MKNEVFISVDIETSGPIPGEYSMLSIGACLVSDISSSFECFVQPTSEKYDPEALQVIGFSLADFQAKGVPPDIAMSLFQDWIQGAVKDSTPIFVGFNSPFDWAFINYYFCRYLGVNPFGYTALDIKSMYFGKMNCSWRETRSSVISKRVGIPQESGHDALKDAQYQAKLFQSILDIKSGVGLHDS